MAKSRKMIRREIYLDADTEREKELLKHYAKMDKVEGRYRKLSKKGITAGRKAYKKRKAKGKTTYTRTGKAKERYDKKRASYIAKRMKKGMSYKDAHHEHMMAHGDIRDPNPIRKARTKHLKKKSEKLRQQKRDRTYKQGGKVGDSVKTYSKGGYVEGK